MAIKGDFEECERCTSFQCNTCGLDTFGDGEVTSTIKALKNSATMALACVLLHYGGEDVLFGLGSLIFPIVAIIVICITKGKYKEIMSLFASIPFILWIISCVISLIQG